MHACVCVCGCVCVCVCVCVPSSSHPTSSESHALHVLPSPPRNKSHTWFTWQGLFELSLTENVDGTASAVRCNIEMFLPALPWKTSPPFFFFFFLPEISSLFGRCLDVWQLFSSAWCSILLEGGRWFRRFTATLTDPYHLLPPLPFFCSFFSHDTCDRALHISTDDVNTPHM